MKNVQSQIAVVVLIACLLMIVLRLVPRSGLEEAPARVEAEIASSYPPATATPSPTAPPTAEPSPSLTASPTVVTPTPTATTSRTPLPPSPTVTPSVTPTPTPAHRPAVSRVALTGFRHEWQAWNNCGPATLAMNLSYYGFTFGQADIAPIIRPNKEDKHASAEQLAAFARSQGLAARVRVNGRGELLKLLLSNGLPVMVATWHIDAKGEQMGHYRLVTGYDDAQGTWTLYDSVETRGVRADVPYEGIPLPYAEFDRLWHVLNRTYLLVYPAAQEAIVRSILGDDLNDAVMEQRSRQRAQQAVVANPEDALVWFTWGTNLLRQGQPYDAAAAYDRARRIGLPFRMLWYQFGPLEAYYQVGRYEDVIALADATLKATTDVEELHYWRGRALLALGQTEAARAALAMALQKRAGYPEAAAALAALP